MSDLPNANLQQALTISFHNGKSYGSTCTILEICFQVVDVLSCITYIELLVVIAN